MAQETHPLPPEQQGTEKSHHFFGLCGGSACGMGGRARRAWKAPSRECHLSKRRPGWELWQEGHSEAEERPKEEWPPGCTRAGTDGWEMVGRPTLPGPLGKAKPPGWPARAGAGPRASAWEEGRDAVLQGSGGLTLPLQGSHPYFCFHPDRVALQGRGHPMLFQNLP